MIVQELIDELLKIQDKSKQVYSTRDSKPLHQISEYSKYILLIDEVEA